jgi:hypothetical protein
VWLERRVGSRTTQFRIERGTFWSSLTGSYHFVIARTRLTTDRAILRRGREHVEISTKTPLKDGLRTFFLRNLLDGPHDNDKPVPHAELKSKNERTVVPLDPEWAGENALLGLKESPSLVLRAHRNLTLPLGGVALVMLLVSLIVYFGRVRSTAGSL